MIINHNISAIFSHRQLSVNAAEATKSAEMLSSGIRINRAADNPAGLAISEKLRAQIRGLNQAHRNVEDGISFIQTTEGYLETTQSILQRLRELAVQSSNGIYTQKDRDFIQVEVSQLVDEIDRIASHAQFNTINMLTGRFVNGSSAPASMWIHMGANMDQRERLFIGTMTATGLGLRDSNAGGTITLSLETANEANQSISKLDNSLEQVSKQRADLGAYQNRLEFASKAIMIGHENMTASESRIRDTDMAEVSTKYARDLILEQTAVSMLAHANMRPQNILKLIQ